MSDTFCGRWAILIFRMFCIFFLHNGIYVFRSRFLREKDREANKECYPQLHYPEIYLLEGGYKAFYENHAVSFKLFDSF